MSVLVLRHEFFEGLGYFTEKLAGSFRYHDLGAPFDGEPYDSLIVLGGPMSANDPEMAPELRLIERGVGAGVPMLGICLGAQLIAKALGARVHHNDVLEIGWAPVHFTEAARRDPVLGTIPTPSTLFHWHGETFDLPPGAEWLAWSEKCRHQAYRYGSRIYGLQFHPEVTPEMIEDWCAQPVNCGDVATLAGPIDAHAFDPSSLARQILENWMRTAKA